MKEIWKDIKGYEGYYQVSNCGRIRSVDRFVLNNGTNDYRGGKEKKPRSQGIGYLQVQLHREGIGKNKYVHRLVAEHFIPNPTELPDINHRDGDKENNNISNLEWTTKYGNHHHAVCKKLITRHADGKFRSSTSTPSQAGSALPEGVEISGEVKPS